MKKKVVMLMAVIMSLSVSANVQAASTIVTETSENSTAEMNITAEKASTFRIEFPDGFQMETSTGTVNYSISASGDIAGDKALEIKPQDMYTAADGDATSDINFKLEEVCTGISLKDPIVVKVTQTTTKLSCKELAADGGATVTGVMQAQSAITAGTWSGTAGYVANIVDVE